MLISCHVLIASKKSLIAYFFFEQKQFKLIQESCHSSYLSFTIVQKAIKTARKQSLQANNNSRVTNNKQSKWRRSIAHPTMYIHDIFHVFIQQFIMAKFLFVKFFAVIIKKSDGWVRDEENEVIVCYFFMATTWSFICAERNCSLNGKWRNLFK